MGGSSKLSIFQSLFVLQLVSAILLLTALGALLTCDLPTSFCSISHSQRLPSPSALATPMEKPEEVHLREGQEGPVGEQN